MRFIRVILAILLQLSPAVPKEGAAELIKKAEKQFENGKYAEAMKSYDQAIKTDPRCSAAYTGRGIIYGAGAEGAMAEGDQKFAAQAFTKAIVEFDQAIKLNPKDHVAFINRGTCHYRLGDTKKALADTDQALRIKPVAQAYIQRGQINAKLGNDLAAAADYGKAYEMNKDAAVLFNRGNCYLRLNQVEKAKADYRLVIKLCKDPRSVAGAKNNLEALEQTGNPNRPARPR